MFGKIQGIPQKFGRAYKETGSQEFDVWFFLAEFCKIGSKSAGVAQLMTFLFWVAAECPRSNSESQIIYSPYILTAVRSSVVLFYALLTIFLRHRRRKELIDPHKHFDRQLCNEATSLLIKHPSGRPQTEEKLDGAPSDFIPVSFENLVAIKPENFYKPSLMADRIDAVKDALVGLLWGAFCSYQGQMMNYSIMDIPDEGWAPCNTSVKLSGWGILFILFGAATGLFFYRDDIHFEQAILKRIREKVEGILGCNEGNSHCVAAASSACVN